MQVDLMLWPFQVSLLFGYSVYPNIFYFVQLKSKSKEREREREREGLDNVSIMSLHIYIYILFCLGWPFDKYCPRGSHGL